MGLSSSSYRPVDVLVTSSAGSGLGWRAARSSFSFERRLAADEPPCGALSVAGAAGDVWRGGSSKTMGSLKKMENSSEPPRKQS